MTKKLQGFSDIDKVSIQVHRLIDELHFTFIPQFPEIGLNLSYHKQ